MGLPITQRAAARLTGASTRSTKRARVVLDKGDPALVQAIERVRCQCGIDNGFHV